MTPIAHADLTCGGLNQPQTDLIVTILEEEIAAPSTHTGEVLQYFSCARQTTCEQKPVGDKGETKTVCTDTYVDLEACKPGDQTFCQRVQVIYSQSGMGLLMLYIAIIYRWAAGVIGIVSVVYLVWGGFMIATAQDDTGAIDKAKEKIMQSIAGLILLFLSAVILYTINPNFFTLSL